MSIKLLNLIGPGRTQVNLINKYNVTVVTGLSGTCSVSETNRTLFDRTQVNARITELTKSKSPQTPRIRLAGMGKRMLNLQALAGGIFQY